jgi:cell filamentation protein
VETGFTNDPHSEQGNACPRNRFGIKNYAELQIFEGPLVAKRGGELEDLRPTGRFDSAHLRAIHRYLFQDVFPWAGEFRVVNLWKGTTQFGPALHLESALVDLLDKLKAEKLLVGLTETDFAKRAAFYLSEINAIHPFREGNGRTQREFIRQLAVNSGFQLSWSGFTQREMTVASIASFKQGDYRPMENILIRALAP